MGVDAVIAVTCDYRVPDEQLADWQYRLFDACGDTIWINRKDGRRALFRPDLEDWGGDYYGLAGDTEDLLAVSLWGRYYGPEYERGHWPSLLGVLTWLKYNVQGDVWYGPDSGAVELWTTDLEVSLSRHHATVGRFPYVHRPTRDAWAQRRCDFCERAMTQMGFGNSFASVLCCGCGFEEETRDRGSTWEERSLPYGITMPDEEDRATLLNAADLLEEQGHDGCQVLRALFQKELR